MKHLNIDYKLTVSLTFIFILMTVVGTLSHELGHYAVAKYLGYEASINYKSSTHWDETLMDYYSKYWPEIKSKSDFPGRATYERLRDKHNSDSFWILLGGPLQTMVTGTIGLLLVFVYRDKCVASDKITLMGWMFIFLSLFWLRQLANLSVGIAALLLTGKVAPTGDEMRLARGLDINLWSIKLITGLIGLAVLFIILRLLPKTMIPTFILAGIVGGSSGYYLWLMKFGQYILP